jgi:hypothetical protein
MNVLSMGRPFGTPGEPVRHFVSQRGHAVRSLSCEGDADFTFAPNDTAGVVLARVQRDWPVDLFVCWCPEVIPPPRNIEACPVRTAAVVSDWTVYYPQLEHNLLRYDVVATDALGAETLARIPGLTPYYFGPLYSHRTGVHRDLGLERDIDIAFAGNLNPAVHMRRGRLLDRVAALSDRYRVVIASDLDDNGYTQLLNRTRIAFNCSLRQEMNLRCFEAVACGALLFLEEENREVCDHLSPGAEVVLYNDDTLVPLIDQYLADREITTAMAKRAQEKAPQLAGEARLDDWIEHLAAAPPSGRPFLDLPPEDRALADVLQHPDATPDWTTLPDTPALTLARGLHALTYLETCAAGTRRDVLREALNALQTVATAHPDAIVPWLNLAFVVRQTNTPDAARRFLEFALEANDTRFGGLLAGTRRDSYYAQWREALARGTANKALLHASAAWQLAVVAETRGDWRGVADWASRSSVLAPEIAAAHTLHGIALLHLNDPAAAAEVLTASLPLPSLDSDHRVALVKALRASGREKEAHTVAEDSLAVFRAWPAATHAAARFEELI